MTHADVIPLFPPYSNDSTSRAAAESIEESAAAKRAAVYRLILEQPSTCDALEVTTGWAHQTVSARIWELHTKQYRITDSGKRALTRRNRWAIIWRVVDDQHPWVLAKRGETAMTEKPEKSKKTPVLKTTDKFAGEVVRDLKAVFEFLHEQDRDDLVTGVLVTHMAGLLQQQEKHAASIQVKRAKLLEAKGEEAAAAVEDPPEPVLWVPPSLPPPPLPPAPPAPEPGVARALDGTVLLL